MLSAAALKNKRAQTLRRVCSIAQQLFANSQLPAAWQAATHKRAAKVGHIEKGSSGGKPQMIALHLYPAAMASFA
jgi:hypothetical protein